MGSIARGERLWPRRSINRPRSRASSRIRSRLTHLAERVAVGMVDGFGTAVHAQNRVELIRPRAVRIDGHADPVFGCLERVLEERIRADAVHHRATLCA